MAAVKDMGDCLGSSLVLDERSIYEVRWDRLGQPRSGVTLLLWCGGCWLDDRMDANPRLTAELLIFDMSHFTTA